MTELGYEPNVLIHLSLHTAYPRAMARDLESYYYMGSQARTGRHWFLGTIMGKSSRYLLEMQFESLFTAGIIPYSPYVLHWCVEDSLYIAAKGEEGLGRCKSYERTKQ